MCRHENLWIFCPALFIAKRWQPLNKLDKTEYIEFDLNDNDKFEDLLKVYQLISESKKIEDVKSDQFWLSVFPDYSLKQYHFSETDLKPEFETAKSDNGTWHFYSMTEHLTENLDVELLECKKINNEKARLNFYANGYPYGGITGLTIFLNSFDFKASKIDEGGGVYDVQWTSDSEFKMTKIKDTLTNSSLLSKIKKLFKS